jgi:Fic family protein
MSSNEVEIPTFTVREVERLIKETVATTKQEMVEEIDKIFQAMLLMRADMKTLTTDGGEGEEFSAIPTSIVEDWRKLYANKYSNELQDRKVEE